MNTNSLPEKLFCFKILLNVESYTTICIRLQNLKSKNCNCCVWCNRTMNNYELESKREWYRLQQSKNKAKTAPSMLRRHNQSFGRQTLLPRCQSRRRRPHDGLGCAACDRKPSTGPRTEKHQHHHLWHQSHRCHQHYSHFLSPGFIPNNLIVIIDQISNFVVEVPR